MSHEIPLSEVLHERLFQFVEGGAIYRRETVHDEGDRFAYRVYDLNLGDAPKMVPEGRLIHRTRDLRVIPVPQPGEEK